MTRDQKKFVDEGFEKWLAWDTTLEMIEEVAYGFGDIIHLQGDTSRIDETTRKLLLAAYSAGALNMALAAKVPL